MKKWILLGAAMTALFTGLFAPTIQAAPAVGTDTAAAVKQRIDRLMDTELERLHIPGAAVVVTEGERILFSGGYGYANVEQKKPMNPASTAVRIGSLTKLLTAVAALQLTEDGRLELHRDINAYTSAYQVPSFPGHPLTLHHLLTHTSGLDQSLYGVLFGSEEEQKAGDGGNSSSLGGDTAASDLYLKNYFKTQPPVRPPGERFEYANINYGIIASLIGQTDGGGYSKYMAEHLFRPLEMNNAALDVEDENPDQPVSYSYTGKEYEKKPYDHFRLLGAGEISMTPEQFSHVMVALLNEGQYKNRKILKPETVKAMQALQYTPHPELDGFGYSLYRSALPDGTPMLQHTGEVDGFLSEMTLLPSARIGIYVVVNALESDLALHREVVSEVLAAIPEVHRTQEGNGSGAAAGGNNKDSGAAQQEKPQKGEQAAVSDAADENLEQYAGYYSYRISPVHGWGRWVRFFEGASFKVAAGENGLNVTGKFPSGEGDAETKAFIPAGNGLFKEQDGPLKIWMHQVRGEWKLTGIDEVTMDRLSFAEHPKILLTIYVLLAVIWPAVLLYQLVRQAVRKFRRRASAPLSIPLLAIPVLFIVYLPVHFLYALVRMTYGFPAWYRIGVCSLPFAASAVALVLLVKYGRQLARGERPPVLSCAVAVMALVHTGFLLYWNMLSIHLF